MNRTALSIALALVAFTACSTSMAVPGDCSSIVLGSDAISPESLVQEVGVAEAEAKNLRDGIPFGDRNAEWTRLKQEMQPGDELWFYRDNRALAGAEGFLLIRDCEVVAFVMTTKY